MLREWKFEFQLDIRSDKALYLQIADAIIKDIQSGRLKSGEALPGSRNLAAMLKVNRNTVVEALNVLLIEGWLVSKERRGTFVSDSLPDFEEVVKSEKTEISLEDISNPSIHIVFDDGYPDSKIAPVKELARAYRQIFNRKARWQMMGYNTALGDLEFRKNIVQMLNHQRGMQIHEQNLCITRGSQMAMYLSAHCILEKGDYVMVENPGYKSAWKAFESAGAKLLPVQVDQDGLLVSEVLKYLKSSKKIKALYTTPHHQYPTTVTLSLQRRLELIKLSNKYGFTIIEDDYDNEFHFGYRPVLPLSSFEELQNYIYIGTLSKVVAPALRIGFLASNNPSFIEKIGKLRSIIDVQGDSIMEQAVLQLVKDGIIRRHIKKATHLYKTKRDFTVELLNKYLKEKASFDIPEGGLAIWIVPNKQLNWDEIYKKMYEKGIKIITPDVYSFDESVNGLRLGYGTLSEDDLEKAIKALAKMF